MFDDHHEDNHPVIEGDDEIATMAAAAAGESLIKHPDYLVHILLII